MNRRNKKKAEKESFRFHRGQMIWKNSAYTPLQYGRKKYRYHLFYNAEGNDCYFKTFGKAKSYIDKNFPAYEARRKLPFFPELVITDDDDSLFSYELTESDKVEVDKEFNREVFVWQE